MTLPRGQSRARLVIDDPDRSLAYVWAVDGGLNDAAGGKGYTLTGGGRSWAVPRVPTDSPADNYQTHFFGAFRLPPDVPPGDYLLDAGRGPEFPFAVVAAPPPRKLKALNPGATAAVVADWLAKGYDVDLAPGLYEWAGQVVLPPGPCRLRGYGAVIRRLPAADPSQYRQRVFWRGTDFTLEGVTVEPADVVFHAGPWSEGTGTETTGTGFVLKNVTVRGGTLGYVLRELVVRDCLFDRSGMCEGPGDGLWLQNEFRGRGPLWTFVVNYGSAGTLAMVENHFDRTSNGPFFQGTGCTDGLFFGTTLTNLVTEANGCEAFACEGEAAEFSRNLILHTRNVGGVGRPVSWYGAARGNRVQDYYCDGPAPFWVDGVSTGNTFNDCETGGGWYFGPGASGNVVAACGVRWGGPSRENQSGLSLPSYDRLAAIQAVGPTAATNIVSSPRVFIGPGLVPFGGVSVESAKVNGVVIPDSRPAAGGNS